MAFLLTLSMVIGAALLMFSIWQDQIWLMPIAFIVLALTAIQAGRGGGQSDRRQI